MRVIAGLAKRMQLETPAGINTRPTTDRIKETLFNMLQPYILDCDFLDLFAGSGAIGIEALSRGAASAVFVEQGKEALACIKRNLERTKLEHNGIIYSMDVMAALKSLEKKKQIFDIVFMDPPYAMGYEQRIIEYLENSSIMGGNTLLIFETTKETDLDFIDKSNFTIDRIKNYSTNKHIFVRKKQEPI